MKFYDVMQLNALLTKELSAQASPLQGFLINLACIFTIVFLSCHNLVMSKHTTLVLGYLLLQGYDVSGPSYASRVAGLLQTAGYLYNRLLPAFSSASRNPSRIILSYH